MMNDRAKRTTPQPWQQARKPSAANPQAKILRDIVDQLFDGGIFAAAKAFNIHHITLWRFLTGRWPISKPMLGKMRAMLSEQKQRQRRVYETLGRHDREAAIILAQDQINVLAAEIPRREWHRLEIARAQKKSRLKRWRPRG